MRKKFIPILLILILSYSICNNLFSQKSKTDSLYLELHESKTDSLKVYILNKLTLFLRCSYPDSALFFANQAELLAEKINYHKIKGKYLQLYLNEFAYKLNRRYFGEKLFDRLIIASISCGGK